MGPAGQALPPAINMSSLKLNEPQADSALWSTYQRSVWPESQSVTFDIVFRCFENKNNKCCETNICKNAICLLFINLQIHNLATLMPGHPSHRVARNGFLNNKQMAFLKKKFTTIIFFIFKTSEYNVKCDGLWSLSNKSWVYGRNYYH